jgi:drug/metabolite transporter superfamily protein YnfA
MICLSSELIPDLGCALQSEYCTVKLQAHKPGLLSGAAVLVGYGFVPTLQPDGASFSRVYAVYGGMFVVMSYAWGWAVDGDRPDTGDFVGGAVAVGGTMLAWFWPRSDGNSTDSDSLSATPSLQLSAQLQ